MDVLYFLNERTVFIRRFYETASQPFDETLRKIDAEEPPFEEDKHWDGNGPPFEVEWQEAFLSLQVLGQTCVSMLSEAIKLYFQTWEGEFRIKLKPKERERYFEKNQAFVLGYQKLFAELRHVSWDGCPADFRLLEQITLARNASQHPNNITTLEVRHDMKSRQKIPSPFFMSDVEQHMFSVDSPLMEWFAPSVHVSRDKLMAAINEVELAAWSENRLIDARYIADMSQSG